MPETPLPTDEAALVRFVRTRTGIVLVSGVVIVLVAAVIIGTKPGHPPAATTARNVPLAVSCPSVRYCVAVDTLGHVVRRNEGGWSKPVTVETDAMNTVSCASVTFCLAADEDGYVLRVDGHGPLRRTRIDGRAGRDMVPIGLNGISAVSCATASFCMIADVLGRYQIFRGRRWTSPAHVEPTALSRQDQLYSDNVVTGLSCPLTAFCAAVTARGRAMTWNGTKWSTPVTLAGPVTAQFLAGRLLPVVSDVSCTGPSFCMAVGTNGDAYRYDGESWSTPQLVDAPSVTLGARGGLRAVSCASMTCVAVDAAGGYVVFDGSVWSSPGVADPTLGLSSVSCASPRFCVALDDLGYALVFNGRQWSPPLSIDP